MSFYGSLYTQAPEVVSCKNQTEKSDMWSVGVMTFCLLTSVAPFFGKDEDDVREKILGNDWDFDYAKNSSELSKNARNFIEKLLEPNETKRLSAEEALKHPFITENLDPKFIADKQLLSYLKNVVPLTEFEQINTKILCELLPYMKFNFIEKAMTTFVAINTSNSGELTQDELVHALIENDIETDSENAVKIFQTIDWDQSKSISWSEFLCSLARVELSNDDSNLKKVYDFLSLKDCKGRMKDLRRAYEPHLFRFNQPTREGEDKKLKALLNQVKTFNES